MAQATATVQTYRCMACGQEWSRPTARGQRPKWCPDCRAKNVRGRCCPECGKLGIRASQSHCSVICAHLASGRPTSSHFYVIECEGGCGRLWGSPTATSRICRRCTARQRLAQPALTDNLLWINGPCSRCGSSFTTYTTNGMLTRFCSDRCRQGYAGDVYRARGYGVEIEPFDRWRVFEDAGWICWLCREPIDPSLPVTDAMAATIDHVVPLVAGGRHAFDNVLPAHRVCNEAKGIEQVGQPY